MPARLGLRIPARDGTLLACDALLPPGGAPAPVVLLRTPYGRGRLFSPPWRALLDQGYALAAVDVRGRGDSDGNFEPWVADDDDGYDVVEWLAAQEWCDGNVGMVGGSYDAATQWWTARAHPPHLRCIVPMAVGVTDHGHERFAVTGGRPWQYMFWWTNLVAGRGMQDPAALSWAEVMDTFDLRELPDRAGRELPAWLDYLDGHRGYGHGSWNLQQSDFEALDTPVLQVLGWWDDLSTLETWRSLQVSRRAAECRLIVGAWDHVGNLFPRPVLGGVDVRTGITDVAALVAAFLDMHLRQIPPQHDPRVRVVRTGELRWEEHTDWPMARAEATALHLAPDGALVASRPTRRLCARLRGEPDSPVEQMGSLDAMAWNDPPLDVRYLERRPDVLTFTSDLLPDPLCVSGMPWLELALQGEAEVTDLVAWLTDVHPEGPSLWVRIQPAGLRVKPRGTVRLDLGWLHHVFLPGHRVRLDVTGTFHPYFGRLESAGPVRLGGTLWLPVEGA